MLNLRLYPHKGVVSGKWRLCKKVGLAFFFFPEPETFFGRARLQSVLNASSRCLDSKTFRLHLHRTAKKKTASFFLSLRHFDFFNKIIGRGRFQTV